MVRYGLPHIIVSDNGSQFSSQEFRHFCEKFCIRQQFSAPYHPATNGQVERAVQTFKLKMKAMPNNSTHHIRELVDSFLFQYRALPSQATKISPAEMFLGHQIRIKLDLLRAPFTHTIRKPSCISSCGRKNSTILNL